MEKETIRYGNWTQKRPIASTCLPLYKFTYQGPWFKAQFSTTSLAFGASDEKNPIKEVSMICAEVSWLKWNRISKLKLNESCLLLKVKYPMY